MRIKSKKVRGVRVVEFEEACKERKSKRRARISKDENIDWGEFKTIICCNDDPNFGG